MSLETAYEENDKYEFWKGYLKPVFDDADEDGERQDAPYIA